MSKTGCSELAPAATDVSISATGDGESVIRGPVHLERRATTSASMSRSVKAILGCDFKRCQASLVGIVSVFGGMNEETGRDGVGMARGVWGCCKVILCDDCPTSGMPSDVQGQLSHAAAEISEIFSQNALPKESSAQAGQLEGSPEQLAGG